MAHLTVRQHIVASGYAVFAGGSGASYLSVSAKSVTDRPRFELELERACKGPDNLSYEYGEAYRPAVCGTGVARALIPNGFNAACRSAFGVSDLHGGVWTWTQSAWKRDSDKPGLVALRGGQAIDRVLGLVRLLVDGAGRVILPTRQDIADITDLRFETISRIVKQLERSKVLTPIRIDGVHATRSFKLTPVSNG